MVRRAGGVGETLSNYKGGLGQSLWSLTEGGRGGEKSKELPYVIYEQPLTLLDF